MDYFEYRDAIFSSNLTTNQKMVAFAISYHYNWKEKSPAFPSNATLSRETGLCIASIVRAKKVLSENGWVLIKRRLDDTSEYTPAMREQQVCYQSSTNNEYNNEYNNEVNNEINNDNKSSNEDLYLNSKEDKKPEETITLDTNEIIAPNPLVNKGAAGPARKTEHQRLLELADELWA